jgi:hypothetical protein
VLGVPSNFGLFHKEYGGLKVIGTWSGVAREVEVCFVEASDAVCIVGRLLDGIELLTCRVSSSCGS